MEFGNLAETPPQEPVPLGVFIGELFRTPTVLLLMLAFCGANSVASIFMNWTILLMVDKFHISTTQASFDATFYIQLASVVGAVVGGFLADRFRRKMSGGRILVQGLGLLLGTPFIYLCTMSESRTNFIFYITLFGLFKGIYDSNIWASMFDVIAPSRRGATVGIANMAGWGLGSLISMLVGSAVTRLGLKLDEAMASSSVVYAFVAMLLLFAAFAFAPRDVQRSEITAEQPSEPA
jgi:MFS family permease